MRLLNLAKLGVVLAVLIAQFGVATPVWADSVPSTPAVGQPTSAGGDPVSAVMPGAVGALGTSGTSGAGGTPANDAPQPGSSSPSTSSGDSGSSGSAGSDPGTPNGSAGTPSSNAGTGPATATPNADGGSTNAIGTDQTASGGTVPSAPAGTGQDGGTPGAPNGAPSVPSSAEATPPPPPTIGADGAGAGSSPDPTAPDPTAPDPTAPDPTAAPNESNATSQNIWQVQISGCTNSCQGTTQTQSAEQQNTTVQVLDGTAAVPTTAGTQTGSGASSQSTPNVTQVQLGCMADCFGSTSTMSAAISTAALQALQQVLSVLGTIGSQSQTLGQETKQNTVGQSISQWQDGAPVQSQIASQSNVTAEVTGFTRSVANELQAELAPSMPAVAGVSNATEQGIWQVQVGCIIFCSGTVQSQRADQSNTTVQMVGAGAASAVQAGAEAVNIATQLIWQLQVGCLFWCYDTIQIQSAASSNNTLQVVGAMPAPPGTPPPPPPAPGQTTGGGSAVNGSAGPPDTSSGSPGASGSADSPGGAGSGADPGTPASAGGSSSGSGNPVASGGSATPVAGGSSGTPGSGGPVFGVPSTGSFVSNVVGTLPSAPLAGGRGSDAHTPPPPNSKLGGVAEATGRAVDATGTPHGAALGTVVIATSATDLHPAWRSTVRTAAGPGGRQAAFNLPRLSMSFPAATGTAPTHDRSALGPAEIALLVTLGIVLVGFACLRAIRAADRSAAY